MADREHPLSQFCAARTIAPGVKALREATARLRQAAPRAKSVVRGRNLLG